MIPRRVDPFAPTANVELYVPRDATEQALVELMRSVRDRERNTALVGPPGLGKTFLLRLLGERLAPEFDAVYVANGALSTAELCAWVLGERGQPRSDVPLGSLLEYAQERRAAGRGLLLLLDDAGAIPVATLVELHRLAAASGGSLVTLVAANDDPAVAEAVVHALGVHTDVIQLTRPMSESETRRYVEERLQRTKAPRRVRELFDAETLARLHRECAGVPRELHSAAAEIIRAAESRLAGSPPPREAAPGAASERAPAPAPLQRLRAVPPPSRARVFQTALVLAAASVAVVLIRTAILLEPAPHPAASQARPGGVPGDEIRSEAEARPVPARPETVRVHGPFPVQINATPWASVQVDGVDVGVTPIAGLPLLAGRHRFHARMPDGRVVERTVEIDADNRFVVFD